MKLYHGSNAEILKIDLEKSKPFKDFGKGFYLSDNYQQAFEMAQFKSLQLGGEPIVTSFYFDENLLKDPELKIKIFNEYSKEWARFVLDNRSGVEVESFDIVYGPIADDKVGFQIRRLKDGIIDENEFMERLKYMRGITFQYFSGTDRAIEKLMRI